MDHFTWSFGVYLFCLVVGLGFAIVSGFLGGILHMGDGGDVGIDHDFSVDHDFSADTDASVDHDLSADHADSGEVGAHLSPISPPVLSTFLAGFGFAGMVSEKALHLPWFLSGPLATAFSLGMAVLAFVLVGKLMSSSQGTSHVRFSDMIGTEAEVITPIPAEGVGEIAYNTPTGRISCAARSETGAMIPKHSMVTITQVVGSVAMVRETIDEQLRHLAVEEQTETEAPRAEEQLETQ
jgi:membrane protein implicated in regulation of membrane protease activity